MDYLKLIEERLKDHPGRLLHSIGVMEECIRMAKKYNLDVQKAKSLGILHDIAKKLSIDVATLCAGCGLMGKAPNGHRRSGLVRLPGGTP